MSRAASGPYQKTSFPVISFYQLCTSHDTADASLGLAATTPRHHPGGAISGAISGAMGTAPAEQQGKTMTVDAEFAELILAAWLEPLARLNLPNSIRARAWP